MSNIIISNYKIQVIQSYYLSLLLACTLSKEIIGYLPLLAGVLTTWSDWIRYKDYWFNEKFECL